MQQREKREMTGNKNIHRVVYPGSFDPVTNGHIDVIERASCMFGEMIIGLATDTPKKTTFTVKERVQMLEEVCAPYPNVRIEVFDKLLVEWARQKEAVAIVRGLRALSDFEFEFQMALTNRKLCPEVETVFLMTREEYACVSSSVVKEIAELGGTVDQFVPECVEKALKLKVGIT
jgi:pantetheine-phosphate adenylyltransferase